MVFPTNNSHQIDAPGRWSIFILNPAYPWYSIVCSNLRHPGQELYCQLLTFFKTSQTSISSISILPTWEPTPPNHLCLEEKVILELKLLQHLILGARIPRRHTGEHTAVLEVVRSKQTQVLSGSWKEWNAPCSTWMDPDSVILSRVSQTEKDNYLMISLTRGI